MAGHVDGRADVYALTCVLFQCVTGEVPYPRDSDPAKMFAHAHTPPPAPTEMAEGVPPALDGVIARGMAKEPADRYATAGELAAAAQQAVREPVPEPTAPLRAPPPPPPPSPQPYYTPPPAQPYYTPQPQQHYTPVPAYAPPARRKSLFWVWSILPVIGVFSWVHALLVTRMPIHIAWAAVYAVPFSLALAFNDPETGMPPGVAAVVAVFWLAGLAHAWLSRPLVERQRARY